MTSAVINVGFALFLRVFTFLKTQILPQGTSYLIITFDRRHNFAKHPSRERKLYVKLFLIVSMIVTNVTIILKRLHFCRKYEIMYYWNRCARVNWWTWIYRVSLDFITLLQLLQHGSLCYYLDRLSCINNFSFQSWLSRRISYPFHLSMPIIVPAADIEDTDIHQKAVEGIPINQILVSDTMLAPL